MTQAFSTENVHYMKKFYQCFPIYLPELNKLKWEHYLELLKIDDIKIYCLIREDFYLRVAMFCKSSVLELRDFINNDIYKTI